ncbi:MAG: tRNA (N6-isopentenyl adenosine(37)-C2)-methylthiotransferase MiaB [Deltaproteobacteria bacterium]
MGKEVDNFAGAEKFVFLETFGCQMNENDSTRILGALRDINYSTTDDPVEADLIILNTCSVRDRAEHKVYSALGKFKDLKSRNPGLIIGVAGCVAQSKGTMLLKRIKHLDLVLGPHNIHRLKAMVLGAGGGKRLASIELTDGIASEEYGYVPDRASVKASVSIMRGCDNFCTYCIVPYTRGREASRGSAEIIDEVNRLANNGVKEVTLLGQNVNSYGKGGSTEASFPELLSMVCGVDGIERVRFLTSHPKDISDELIRLFDKEEKLCRHVHLPVQSGSDNILKAMGRGYTAIGYLKKADALRRLYPGISITTDIITGFPGETDRDFEDTLSLIRRARFDNSFAFMYSPRPHTAAESLKGRIPDEIKSSRLHAVQELQREIAFEMNKLLVGRTVSVLVEGRSKADPEEMSGRTSCNRIVNLSLPHNMAGRIIDILINKAYPNSLRGIHEKRSGLC